MKLHYSNRFRTKQWEDANICIQATDVVYALVNSIISNCIHGFIHTQSLHFLNCLLNMTGECVNVR